MKKKTILITSILGATALAAGLFAVKGLVDNNKIKTVEENEESLSESTLSEDLLFSNGLSSITAGEVKRKNSVVANLEEPEIGFQYATYENDTKLAIRYYAIISDLNVTATWSRALYNSDGTEVLALAEKQSTVAYKKLAYTDGTDTKYLEAENGKYFVVYTLTGITLSKYKDNNLVAKLTLSDGANSIESSSGSVTTNSTPKQSKVESAIYLNKTTKKQNSNNGVYEYQTIKTIYSTADTELDISCACVPLSSETISASGFSAGQAGKQTITLTSGNLETSYDIYVLNIEEPITSSVKATVDASYSGTIGDYGSTAGYQFKTITQALEFLQNTSFVAANATKTLDIKAGTYNEKIEINTPNLTITGAGAASTKIEFNSLYGQLEGNGFMNKTDSTQTVAIRESATNCHISDITISNYYNTIGSYADTIYAGSGERGLAFLCQADQVVIENSKFLGWQDTVELFTGRQYFKNCYISGCIDYIFGTNSTSYFDQCEIHTVAGKTNASPDNVNAYVTAFKGTNHDNGSDKIAYGAIFNNCNFTSDTGFVGEYAIARPWTKYSNVSILNSTFDGNVATDLSRTIALGLIKTYDDNQLNIKLYENNVSFNDDLDSVDASLSASQAANYVDYSVVYGTANGYAVGWHPVNGLDVDNNTYYVFDGNSPTTGTVYNYTDTTGGAVNTTFNGLTINTKKCLYYSQGYTEVQPGTMSLQVAANTTLTVRTGYNTYNAFSVNGVYTNSADLSLYFENAGTATITFTSKVYILEIIVSPNSNDSEPSLSSIEVTNSLDDIQLGDDYDLSLLRVKANYDDNTFKYITDFTSNAASVVDNETPGEYEVTISYGGESTTTTITYVGEVSDVISKDTTFVLGTGNEDLAALCTENVIQNKKVTVGKFEIDATNGKLRVNSTNNSQILAGTKITFKVAANSLVTITAYSAGDAQNYTLNGVGTNAKVFSQFYSSETTVVLLITSGNPYLEQIAITANATAPAAATLQSLTLSGYDTNEYTTGTNYDISGLIVKANYSDNSIHTLSSGYTIDDSDVDNTTAGTYQITVSYNDGITEVSESFNVVYVAPSIDNSITKTTALDFSSNTNTATALGNTKVDYSNATVAANKDNLNFQSGYITFDVKAGALITVGTYKTNGNYKIGTSTDDESDLDARTATYTYTASSDCTIAIYGYSGNQLSFIGISYPISESTTYSFLTSVQTGEVDVCSSTVIQGVDAYRSGLIIEAKNGKVGYNNSSWGQINNGTKLTFTVATGASINIYFYTTDFEINGTQVSSTTVSLTSTQTTTYTIEATGNTYISKIVITF